MSTTKPQINARVDAALLKRLRSVTEGNAPYRPTITQIVERGIELALAEWEKRGVAKS